MKIKKYANKKVITISRVEWIKIGKQLGIDMGHPSFRKVFLDGFVNKFSIISRTLMDLIDQISENKVINKNNVSPVINSDIQYIKYLSENMPDDAEQIKTAINSCILELEKCVSSIGSNDSHNIIKKAIDTINNTKQHLLSLKLPESKVPRSIPVNQNSFIGDKTVLMDQPDRKELAPKNNKTEWIGNPIAPSFASSKKVIK